MNCASGGEVECSAFCGRLVIEHVNHVYMHREGEGVNYSQRTKHERHIIIEYFLNVRRTHIRKAAAFDQDNGGRTGPWIDLNQVMEFIRNTCIDNLPNFLGAAAGLWKRNLSRFHI